MKTGAPTGPSRVPARMAARDCPLFDQCPHGVFEFDAEGRCLDVNATGAAMFGRSEEAMRSLALVALVAPAETTRMEDALGRTDGFGAGASEWQFLGANGSVFPGELLGRRSPDGHLQVTLRDISASRQTEALLRESGERYALATQGGRLAVWHLDLATGKLDSAGALERLLGFREGELGTDSARWRALTHPDDRQRTDSAWRELTDGERDRCDMEYRVLDGEGTPRWIEVRCGTVKDARGRPIAINGITLEISARKLAEGRAASELDAMKRLQELGRLAAAPGELQAVLLQVVETAVAITGADFGNIQLLDPETGNLRIAAQQGFDRPWLEFWDAAGAGQGSCGAALDRSERVVVEDVEHSPVFAGTQALEVQRQAGVRAVLSTPIAGRGGLTLGMLSTHYRTPGRPQDRSLHLLELLARQAADIIEHFRHEEALRASELRHRTLVEATSTVTWSCPPLGGRDGPEPGWMAFTGQTADEMSGDGWARAVHPDDAAEAVAGWRRAAASGQAYSTEYRVRRRDGAWRWMHVRAAPVRDVRGQVVEWMGMGVDVTERRNMEAELVERENLLRTITENSDDTIFMVDRDHRLRYANPRVIAIVGRIGRGPAADGPSVIGKTAVDLFGDTPFARELMKLDEEVMRSGQANSRERPIATAAGTRFLMTTRTPVFGPDGRVIGLIGLGRDITGRRVAEAERLTALERQRDILVREVHHRIKNHLQGIVGLLQNRAAARPEAAAQLAEAATQVRTVAQVYGLQARGDDGSIRLCDILRLAAEGVTGPVAAEFRPLPDQRTVRLAQEEAVPLALVVNELVTNAVKHLATPDPARPVQVSMDADPDGIRIEIRSGPARLPEDFEARRRTIAGTGLELVHALLPRTDAELSYRQDGDAVVTVLRLAPPIVAW